MCGWLGPERADARPRPAAAVGRPLADEEIRRELALTDEWPAGNEARTEAVRRHLPDIELVDVEAEPEPYAARGRPWRHGNGCAFDRAVYSGLSRSHLRALCEFSDEVKSLRCYQRYHDMQGLYDVAHLRRDISSRGQRPAMPVLVDTEAPYPGTPGAAMADGRAGREV